MSRPTAIVLGGGLAGIAAAVRLASAGVAVTLVETRQRLGGRATSFVDPTTGQVLDNCQHVLLGCCTNLLDLYARLGVAQCIAWQKSIYFATPVDEPRTQWVIDTLQADDLPAPLHLSASLLAFQGLKPGEKIALARAMLAMMRIGRTGRAGYHGLTFARFLDDQGQPRSLVEKFWAPVGVGAVNETVERMPADYAMQVFQEGMLAHQEAWLMGLASVPLVKLYDPAEKVITAAGGQVLLSTSVQGFSTGADGSRVTGLQIDGGRELHAEVCLSALPFDRVDKLLTPAMRAADARLARLGELTVSPILGIHLFFRCPPDRPVMNLPHVALTRSPLHWVFNKSMDVGEGGGMVQHLHGVISAAHDLVDQPAEAIMALALEEIARVFPRARGSKLHHARVIKEKRATFSARPGIAALRPAQAPGPKGVRNLYLAGDWTATGWPATMEGATRSGYLAAAAALADLGLSPGDNVPDLPASAVYRMLAGK